MNLESLIPNNDRSWVIKNNMIYYHHYCYIALLQKRNNFIWVILDKRCPRQVLKIVSHLIKSGIKFYFNSKALSNKKNIDDDYSKSEIIYAYLYALESSTIFDGFDSIGFDYVENLKDYIVEYECMSIFNDVYLYYKDRFMKKEIDWYSNTDRYIVERDDIREFLCSVDRQIKLSMFL